MHPRVGSGGKAAGGRSRSTGVTWLGWKLPRRCGWVAIPGGYWLLIILRVPECWAHRASGHRLTTFQVCTWTQTLREPELRRAARCPTRCWRQHRDSPGICLEGAFL